MRAGRLRHRVTLEWWQAGERTASGATPSDWMPGRTVRAEVEQLRGRTLFAAQAANAETTAVIRMRWRPEVADATGKTLRLRYGDQVYRIDGRPVDKGGRRRELEIMCHEWV